MSKKCILCNQELPLDLFGEAQQSPVQKFIATYCDSFSARYHTNPVIRGSDAGAAKRIVKDLGFVRACSLIEVYLTMDDSYFINSRHDLMVFEKSIQKVAVAHDTGATITRNQAQQIERRSTNRNAFARLLKKTES